jgi:hypothetical protein
MSEPNNDNGEAPPLNPDLAGYPSVDALVGGYRASGQEAKRLSEENLRISQERDQFRLLAAQAAANPRQDVPQRNGSANPYDRLAEYGVPSDAIREVITSEIQTAFQPLQRGFEARNQILARYPDYNKFESDVASYIQSDPALNQTYQRMFTADPVGAFEYAFLKFGEDRRRTHPQGGSGEIMGDQAHAQIPNTRTGDARRMDATGDETREAYRKYQQTGSPQDAREYAKLRLRNVISDDFLNE